MTTGISFLIFFLGAVISLLTSWVLVSRLERVGERLGLSEALLGMVAALAADAPEITASITALAHHQTTIGAGVVLGSNVFNLAALLGLGAIVAVRIDLHRKVVIFGGTVAMLVAVVCLVTVGGQLSPTEGLVLVIAVLVPYTILLGAHRSILGRLGLTPRLSAWLHEAIVEEESELEEAIHPRRGSLGDALVAGAALVVVVGASVAMERGAASLGAHFAVPEIIIGGLVLAAVTSLPNAVSAIYLARRGRGAATLSTALNSNSLNVAAGLLLPAAIIGLARPSGSGILVASWYLGLTVLTLALAYVDHGLRRGVGGADRRLLSPVRGGARRHDVRASASRPRDVQEQQWSRQGPRWPATGRSPTWVADSEDTSPGAAYLRGLRARRLAGLELDVSDQLPGLTSATAAVLAGATRQRCRLRLMQSMIERSCSQLPSWPSHCR